MRKNFEECLKKKRANRIILYYRSRYMKNPFHPPVNMHRRKKIYYPCPTNRGYRYKFESDEESEESTVDESPAIVIKEDNFSSVMISHPKCRKKVRHKGPPLVPGEITAITVHTEFGFHKDDFWNILRLTWSKAQSNGSAIKGYNIDVNGLVFNMKGRICKFEVIDLEPMSLFRVRIQAINSIGVGPFSKWKVARSLIPSATLEPPKLLCIERNLRSLRFWWGDAKPVYIVSFSLEEADQNCGFKPIYSGPGLSFLLDKLDAGTEYEFRICAIYLTGPGPYSTVHKFSTLYPVSYEVPVYKIHRMTEVRGKRRKASTSFHTRAKICKRKMVIMENNTEAKQEPAKTIPGAVSDVSGIPFATDIYLKWSEPSPVECEIKSYKVTFNDITFNTYKKVEEIILKGLHPGKEYSIQVQAISDDNGEGPLSEALLVKTHLITHPPKMKCLYASHNSLRLYWGGAEREDIISYCVEMQCSNKFKTCYHGPNTNCTLSHLKESTSYFFRVCVFTLRGKGSYSCVYRCKTLSAPAAKKASPISEVMEDGDEPSGYSDDEDSTDEESVKVLSSYPVKRNPDNTETTLNDGISFCVPNYMDSMMMNYHLWHLQEKLTDHDRKRSFVFKASFYSQMKSCVIRVLNPPVRQLHNLFSSQFSDTQNRRRIGESELRKLFDSVIKVDLFKKDLIFVPAFINDRWILIIICNPGLVPKTSQSNSKKRKTDEGAASEVLRSNSNDADGSDKSDLDDEYIPDDKLCGIFMFDNECGQNIKLICSYIRRFLKYLWMYRKGVAGSSDFDRMNGYCLPCSRPVDDHYGALTILYVFENFFKKKISFVGSTPVLHGFFSSEFLNNEKPKKIIPSRKKKYAYFDGYTLHETDTPYDVVTPPLDRTAHRLYHFLVHITSKDVPI